MEKALRISKLDAASRQAKTAIDLYFTGGDPLSAHTLAAAAFQVLEDLTKKRGKGSSMRSQIRDLLTPEGVKTLLPKLVEAENFAKHADRDPEGVLVFPIEQTELLLLDVCKMYLELSGESLPEMQCFDGWIATQHPQFFATPVAQVFAHMNPYTSREEFYADMLPGMRAAATSSAEAPGKPTFP